MRGRELLKTLLQSKARKILLLRFAAARDSVSEHSGNLCPCRECGDGEVLLKCFWVYFQGEGMGITMWLWCCFVLGFFP